MRARDHAAFALLAACYGPTYPLHLKCSDYATCPPGQFCDTAAWTCSDHAPTVPDASGVVANGGPDQVVVVGSVVRLYATGFDSQSRALTYSWELKIAPSGSASYLTNPGQDASQAAFFPDLPGTYLAELTVWAGGASAVDDVNIFAAAPPPDAPIVIVDAPPPPDAAPPCVIETSADRSAAYQIDPAHTGAQPDGQLRLPLQVRWSRDLGAPVSYALVARGRVFVIAGQDNADQNPAKIYGLDPLNGRTLWGPKVIEGTHGFAAAAYDGGKVFAVGSTGDVYGLDEAGGNIAWHKKMPFTLSFAPPTAACDRLYLNAGELWALDQGSGNVLWSQPVVAGGGSSPAVSPTGVYVSYDTVPFAFEPAKGTLLWQHDGIGSGGGGATVALFGGEVYTRDLTVGDMILDSTDGRQDGSYVSRFIPAVTSARMILTPDQVPTAVPVRGGTPMWSFDHDGPAVAAPIIVGGNVVVATANGLDVLDAVTGALRSSFSLSGIRGDDVAADWTTPLGGLTFADGMLLVPAGTALVAF